MNKKIIGTLSTALVFGTVFAASFGVGFALQIKGADNASFNIGAATEEVKTKVYYQSSFFYGGEGTVYAYAWDSKDDTYKNAAWPGEAMTAEDYKHGLYSYEVSEKYDTIIFHANAGEGDPTKTANLTIDRTNVYYSQHNDAWKSKLEDCTFSYYMTGVINGVSGWGNKSYENGLLKNYAGNKITEYMKCDYVPKQSDSFKVITEDGNTWYGLNGSTSGDNFNVAVKNSGEKSAFVYFTPNSNLWSSANFYYDTNNKWANPTAYQWVEGGSNNGWPGSPMTRDSDGSYWYYASIPLYWNCVIFSNNGASQTADLKDLDMSKPYFKGSGWSETK